MLNQRKAFRFLLRFLRYMVSPEGSPSFHAQKNEQLFSIIVERGIILFFKVSELVLYHPRQLTILNS